MMTRRVIFLAGLMLFFVGGYTDAAECQVYNSANSQSLAASGFGVPYNVHSPQKELNIKAECGESSEDSVSLVLGQSPSYRQLIYKYGYERVDNKWKRLDFSGGALISDAWYENVAYGALSRTPAEFTSADIVAYICTQVGGAWRCGCQDQACAGVSGNKWQSQRIEFGVDGEKEVVGEKAITISAAPGTEEETWFVANSTVTVGAFRFSSTLNEDSQLTRVRLRLRAPATKNDVPNIYLYDGDTLLTTLVGLQFIGGVEDVIFSSSGSGSFQIPANSYRDLTIKADLPLIGSYFKGTAGRLVALDIVSSATTNGAIDLAEDVRAGGVRYMRSIMTVKKVEIPKEALVIGKQRLYKFSITASPDFDVALRKVTFVIATSGVSRLSDKPGEFSIHNLTTDKEYSITIGKRYEHYSQTKRFTDNGDLILEMVADTTENPLPYVIIPAGTTNLFELKGKFTTDFKDDSVTVRFLGDDAFPSAVLSAGKEMGRASEVEASSSNNFIWSDFSGGAAGSRHSLTSDDWLNGYKVLELSSGGLSPNVIAND